MSVCLSVSRSVSVCQSLTVTVMVAAVFQLEVWSGRRNSVRVCLPPGPAHVPLAAHGCLSVRVCLSVCLSLSVCESVCHRNDVTSRPRRSLAPVCPRPARPPPSARPARQAGSDVEVFFSFTIDQFCPNFISRDDLGCFFICSALWPQAFRFCNFLFSYLHLRF